MVMRKYLNSKVIVSTRLAGIYIIRICPILCPSDDVTGMHSLFKSIVNIFPIGIETSFSILHFMPSPS